MIDPGVERLLQLGDAFLGAFPGQAGDAEVQVADHTAHDGVVQHVGQPGLDPHPGGVAAPEAQLEGGVGAGSLRHLGEELRERSTVLRVHQRDDGGADDGGVVPAEERPTAGLA